MKFLVQRVKEVKIFSDGKEIESLADGFLIFVGIEKNDLGKDLNEIKEKLFQYQLAEKDGKFALTLKEANLPIIFVSQITLTANFSKGRINFDQSPKFETAQEIYQKLVTEIKKEYPLAKNTPFGAYLLIQNTNLGPINFFLEI